MDLNMAVDGTVKEYPENTAEAHTHQVVDQKQNKIKKMLEQAIDQWEEEGLVQSLVDLSLE